MEQECVQRAGMGVEEIKELEELTIPLPHLVWNPESIQAGCMRSILEDEHVAWYRYAVYGGDLSCDLVIFKSEESFGKRAHTRRHLLVTVLQGGGCILSSPVDTRGNLLGESRETMIGGGSVIAIPPFVGYTFSMETKSRLHITCLPAYYEEDVILCPRLRKM